MGEWQIEDARPDLRGERLKKRKANGGRGGAGNANLSKKGWDRRNVTRAAKQNDYSEGPDGVALKRRRSKHVTGLNRGKSPTVPYRGAGFVGRGGGKAWKKGVG